MAEESLTHEPPLRRTPEEQQRTREGMRPTQALVGLAVLCAGALLLLGVALLVREGFAGFAEEGEKTTARSVASDLLVLTLLSGVVAAAVTEFLKRVLRLREQFNRASVRDFLGELARFDWSLRSPGGVPVVAVEPTYGAPLSQLCAQLGQVLELLAVGAAQDRLGKDHRALALSFFLDGHRGDKEAGSSLVSDKAPEVGGLLRSPESPPTPLTDALLLRGERKLDAFQLRTRAQWHRMLQWISAGIAAGFMVCVGSAVQADGQSIVVGGLLGLVIGGPVAWAVRDVVRLIEHRAG